MATATATVMATAKSFGHWSPELRKAAEVARDMDGMAHGSDDWIDAGETLAGLIKAAINRKSNTVKGK